MLGPRSEPTGRGQTRKGILTHDCMEKKEESYRPTSKAGEARGESSVAIVKMPSNLRSG